MQKIIIFALHCLRHTNEFAKGVLTSCALSFINYLDAHKYEGKMCVSNGECKDIENAFHNAMWDRLHRYYSKYIEKQGKTSTVLSNSLNTGKREIRGNEGKISPKWSKEDEEEFKIAIETLHEAGQHSSAMWLKSIKQRME